MERAAEQVRDQGVLNLRSFFKALIADASSSEGTSTPRSLLLGTPWPPGSKPASVGLKRKRSASEAILRSR
jgi:hypothetical protein